MGLHLHTLIQCLGLLCDIAGVILLFLYGLPPKVDPEGARFLRLQEDDEDEKRTAKLYRRRGHLGLYLLIAGFSLQIVGTVLSDLRLF